MEDWLAFIREHGAPCFVGWPDSIVRSWLHWHCANRNLIVIHRDGEVLALGIGWQCTRDQLEMHWHPGDVNGDCFYFSQVMARSPEALAALVDEFRQQWPQWHRLKLFARRGPKGLLPISHKTILKLYCLVQRRLSEDNLCAKTLS